MKKVLLITDNHSLTGGGAEKYFFELKKQLKEYVEVFSLGFGPTTKRGDDFIILQGSDHKLIRQWWNMFFHPLKYRKLRNWIKQINPDVIHLHNVRKYTVSLLKAVADYPVVQTVHDHGLVCPTMTNIHQDLTLCHSGLRLKCLFQHRGHYSFLIYLGMLFSFFRRKKLLKKHVKHFISPSPWLENYLTKNQFSPVTYIPPFIQRKPLALSEFNANQFLYVGRLDKNKGIHFVIDEFIAAHKVNPNLVLTIAGSGKLENELKAKITQLGLTQQIRFLGWVEDQEVLAKLYQEANAVIFSSIGLESFGLVLTEAMSYARAIIGSNRGPTSWLIDHEKTGLLYDPLKKGDLMHGILFLASHPDVSAKFGQQGFAKLAEFPSERECIEKIREIYEKIFIQSHTPLSSNALEERVRERR